MYTVYVHLIAVGALCRKPSNADAIAGAFVYKIRRSPVRGGRTGRWNGDREKGRTELAGRIEGWLGRYYDE